MSADPADDTNALLLQLVAGDNSTIRSAKDLPSATFAPSPGIFPVNVLFSVSLTLALVSSFLAVLGQQWLVYYRKRSGGGAEHQRWEQLRRYLGAKRWRLEAILDDVLPGLLQLALVIFCIGFVAYLRTLSKTMCYVIMGPMTTAAAALLLMGIVGAWDRWCPFKSPLSHLLQILGNLIKWQSITARKLANNGKIFFTNFPPKMAQGSPSFLPAWREVWGTVVRIVKEGWGTVVRIGNRALDRSGENVAQLEAVAAKRVLCTSEDFNALIYTAVNLHGMTSRESIQSFLGDETVFERLRELWEGGRRSAGSPRALAGAFSRAFLQLVFMGESAELLVEPRYRQQYSEPLSPRSQDPTSLDLLKDNVIILDECIHMGVESLHKHWNDSIWLLYYCQILKVVLDEKDRGSGLFERWLSQVIVKYSVPGDCKPHIICLVAWGIRMLNMGVVTPMKAFTRGVSDQKWEFEWEQSQLVVQQARVRMRVRVRVRVEGVRLRVAELREGLQEGRGARRPTGRREKQQEWQERLEWLGGLVEGLGWLEERLERLEERLEGRLELPEERLKGQEQEQLKQLEQRLEQLEQELHLYFRPDQRQRAKAVKELVGSVGWEKPLVPKGGLEYPQDTVFGLIKEAFGTHTSQSARRPDNIDVWLLEQALAISTKTQYRGGREFVVRSCFDLLRSLHEVEDTDAGQNSWHDHDDCLRFTRILSQCLQGTKKNSEFKEIIQTVDSVLAGLEQYLPQFTTNFIISRCDNSVLLVWGEIGDQIHKTICKFPWSIRTGVAYRRVKPYFDMIKSATSNLKVTPNVDGNPADPPLEPAAAGQAGPSGSQGTAVTERVAENAEETDPSQRTQEDPSGCRGEKDALVDRPIQEDARDDQQKQFDDAASESVEQENSLCRGTSDVHISFNNCFPFRDHMLL
ncbi:hypothetical protein FRC05_004743 [Tulasnella sp. 425]|nr:hypothetical protein FRC05_004743 [Tulasnella sp. 425]